MASEPCDLLQVETALDLVDGELAVELPAHMRAFARAHADGRPPPSAPALLRLTSTLVTARNACLHDVLLDRGLALLRLIAPILIEADPAVTAARAEPPTWPGLQRVASARDVIARKTFGLGAIELLHTLHGSEGPNARGRDFDAPGPPIEGWQAREPALDAASILDMWQLVAARLGVAGSVRIDRAAAAAADVQPRAFIVEPRREVIVVAPNTVDTPAARFAVMHELGHAFTALAMTPGVPRTVDEAAASYVARAMEPPSWLPPRWPSPLAEAARARRLALAAMLDQIERRLPDLEDVPRATPPWALWHDPGAQAAYVAAEAMADRIRAELGPNPPRGQVLRALTAERDRIDQRTHVGR